MPAKKLRLAVVPTNPIRRYREIGYTEEWLKGYYNPGGFFEKIFFLSPYEDDNPDLLGMHSIRTEPKDFKKRLREFDIDLVRAYGGFWPSDLACNQKADGIPVIVSVHDTSPQMLHDSIKKADAVLCVSEAVRRLVLTRLPDPERVWKFTNRVDFEVMRPRPKQDLADLDQKYPFRRKILHLGRKTRQKNLDTLIQAMKILGPDYGLLAVGKGDTDFYAKLAGEQGVRARCFFVDSIRNNELARYYSWADCLCNPSRWEGFSIALVEALACGAIVVASDIPEIAELIRHQDNGLLLKEYENPQALADMIRIACEDTSVRTRVHENARKSVESYEKSRVDRLEISYYEKALTMTPNRQSFSENAKERLKETLGRLTSVFHS